MAALRELFASFSIAVDSKALEGLNEHVNKGVEKLRELGEVLAGGFVIEKLGEFVNQQVEVASQTENTAIKLGVTTDELQRFGLAANLADVSADSASHALGRLNRSIGEALSGNKELSGTFSKLGISIKNSDGSVRSVIDVAGDVADAVAEAGSAAEKTKIAFDLFGRGGVELLPLLNRGREGIEEASQAVEDLGGTFSEDFLKQAGKVEEEQKKLNFGWSVMKTRIATGVLPAFEWLFKEAQGGLSVFTKLDKETNIVRTGFLALGAGTIAFSFSKLIGLMGGLDKGVFGLVKSMLAFAAPAAVIFGLYLIFDDLYTLFTGGDSVFGELLDDLFGIGASKSFVEGVTSAFVALKGVLPYVASAIIWLGQVIEGVFNFVIDILSAVFKVFYTLGEVIADPIGMMNEFGTAASDAFGTLVTDLKASVDFATQLVEQILGVPGALNSVKTAAEGFLGFHPDVAPAVATATPANYSSGTMSPSTGYVQSQSNDIKINVQGGNGSPSAIGQAVGNAIQGVLGTSSLRAAFGAVGTGT